MPVIQKVIGIYRNSIVQKFITKMEKYNEFEKVLRKFIDEIKNFA